ncbi:MAG: radical SAM protein [Candidatus Omnitrophota bacterium]
MSFWDWIAEEKHLLTYPQTPHGPIGLMYPNEYSIGMANLGFQQVYRQFRESGFSVERIFWDKKGRETRSVENRTPLFRFPYLAASYTYELDLFNLISMMLRGGVEPLAAQRGENAPLVILGGQAASSNPALLSRIADAIVLGEAETIVQKIAPVLEETANSRRMALESLAAIPHVYAPAIHGVFERRQWTIHRLDALDAFPCHTVIHSQRDEFGGAFLLELSRGCHYRCKFCIVPPQGGSARYRDFDALTAALERHLDSFSKAGLLGAAVADHPRVEDIVEWLVKRGKQVSTSSLRAEKISERLLDSLREGGQQTITIAPETGNIESRRRMGKGVSDEKYLRLAEMAGRRGFPHLKLYFLLGVPDGDPMREADDIIRFVRQIEQAFCGAGGGRMTVTVSPFAPKPETPWSGENLWDAKAVKKASRIIRKHLSFHGNIKTPPVNVKEAWMETILCWAGPEAADELLRAAKGEIALEEAFRNFDFAAMSRI